MNFSNFHRRHIDMAMRTDFPSFIWKAATIINPSVPFTPNWHINAIAYQLNRVRRGEIRRLIITLPPRSLKSIICSVAFPAWLLGHDPSLRIMSLAYNQELAARYALEFRTLITSGDYRRAFPKALISPHKDTEAETVFTAGGYRLGTSMTGSLTGRGAQIIICDEPTKAQDIHSDAKRKAINELYRNTILSRLDNKETGAIIVIMQRLHAADFVGALWDGSEEWHVLSLPAIAERDEPIPISDTEQYLRVAGEALQPHRESIEILREIEQTMGPDLFAAQYQQNPVPPGGLMIKKNWIRHYTELPADARSRGQIIQSWDTAGKEGPRNSYSVCTTWLRYNNYNFLLDLVRDRFNYPTLRDTAVNCAKKHKPDVILVEDASTGAALSADMRQAGFYNTKPVAVTMDKVGRIYLQQGKFASGLVHFPAGAAFMPELLRELLSFPQSKTSDQVDSISQALAYEGYTYTLKNIG